MCISTSLAIFLVVIIFSVYGSVRSPFQNARVLPSIPGDREAADHSRDSSRLKPSDTPRILRNLSRNLEVIINDDEQLGPVRARRLLKVFLAMTVY
jgi:hypothetical protein